jgi:hypothetical protein
MGAELFLVGIKFMRSADVRPRRGTLCHKVWCSRLPFSCSFIQGWGTPSSKRFVARFSHAAEVRIYRSTPDLYFPELGGMLPCFIER